MAPFPKGVSGNPSGKSKYKILSDELRMELLRNPHRLKAITNKLIESAEDGDLTAIQMVFDRLEGKPMQSVQIDQTVTNLEPEKRLGRLLELQTRLKSRGQMLPAPETIEDLEIVPSPG